MFKIINNKIDPNKENILFISAYSEQSSYYRAWQPIMLDFIIDKYANKYNICIFAMLTKNGHMDKPNILRIDTQLYKHLNENVLKRKKDFDDSTEYNIKVVFDLIQEFIVDIKFKYIFNCSILILPLQPYFPKITQISELTNEFFDIIDDDYSDIELAKNKMATYKEINPYSILAFTQWKKHIIFELIRSVIKSDSFKHMYTFTLDPAQIGPLFRVLTPNITNFYFRDDNRGLRDYKYFPIAELQHYMYERDVLAKNKQPNIFEIDQVPDQNIKHGNLVAYVTILYTKSNRYKKWDQYLENIKSDKCSLYSPIVKNGVHYKKVTDIDESNIVLHNTVNKMLKNKNFKQLLPTVDHAKVLPFFKYSLILACISFHDSLNFRLPQCLVYDLLPFLDPLYDPAYLQIPKEIQDRLIVNNHIDIDNKIEYYNKHDNERIELLNELKKLTHFNESIDFWYNEIDNCLGEL